MWARDHEQKGRTVGWTIFGKLPCEGDFVRHALVDATTVECFRWIADSVSHDPLWPRRVPIDGLRFLYASVTTPAKVLIGAMIGSRDRVGRDFPLVAVRPLEVREVMPMVSSVPLAWSAALEGVAAALRELALRDTSHSIASCLESVSPPAYRESRELHARATAELGGHSTSDFLKRVFRSDDDLGPEAVSVYHYACHTIRVAVGQVERPSAPALLCPVTSGIDAVTWMEIVRGLLGQGAPPLSMLWTSDREARLIVALSDMPVAALPMIVGSSTEAPRIWPLSTQSGAARARARTLIEPLIPSFELSLTKTIEALAGGGSR